METTEWIKGKGYGVERVRKWIPPCPHCKGRPRRGGKLAAASRHEGFRFCESLCFIVFAVEIRGIMGDRACTNLVLCGSGGLSRRGARSTVCGISRRCGGLEFQFPRGSLIDG